MRYGAKTKGHKKATPPPSQFKKPFANFPYLYNQKLHEKFEINSHELNEADHALISFLVFVQIDKEGRIFKKKVKKSLICGFGHFFKKSGNNVTDTKMCSNQIRFF